MSLRIIRAVALAEKSDEFHVSRILILLDSVGGKNKKPIEGITKLAKLDFLLRYPNCLTRVVDEVRNEVKIDITKANIQEHEKDTIETKMIRFRYGPWDSRYRRWIGLLLAKGLVNTYVKGRTVYVELTDRGQQVARQLKQEEDFVDTASRSDIIAKSVGSYSATRLKDFVYRVVPEITTMKWGEEIEL